jgi:hypothetical protein
MCDTPPRFRMSAFTKSYQRSSQRVRDAHREVRFKMSLRRGFDFVVNDERPRGQWKQTGVTIAGGRDQRAA